MSDDLSGGGGDNDNQEQEDDAAINLHNLNPFPNATFVKF